MLRVYGRLAVWGDVWTESGWTQGTGFLLGAMAGALLGIAVNRLMTRRG